MEKLKSYANSLLNILTRINHITSSSEIEEISQASKKLTEYLPLLLTPQKLTGLDADTDWENFIENYYSKILELMISKFDHSFPVSSKIDDNILNFFVVEHHMFFFESLSVLVLNLKDCSNTQVNGIVILLENLIKSNGLLACLIKYTTQDYILHKYVVETEAQDGKNQLDFDDKFNSLVQCLVSLPNKIANRLVGKAPIFFTVENFCKILSINLVRSIYILSELSKENIAFNIKPLSEYFSKYISNLNNQLNSEALKSTVKIFESLSNEDTDIQKIIQHLFSYVSGSSLEISSILLLRYCAPKKNNIYNILSNVIELKEWKYVFLTKIPLLTYYDHNNLTFIHNLALYIMSSTSNNFKLAQEFLLNLLTTWSSKSAITHTSLEQHLYITKIIIITSKYFSAYQQFSSTFKHELTEKLIKGIPLHLESPNISIRIIGMVTAEILTSLLKNHEEIELKFEYDGFKQDAQKLVQDLKDLTKDIKLEPETNDVDELCFKLAFDSGLLGEVSEITNMTEKTIEYPKLNRKASNFANKSSNVLENASLNSTKNNLIIIIDSEDFELDSDDDLEPYDLSNDTKYSKKEAPSYLRDLRDNLYDVSDPEIFNLSLEIAQKLITSQLPNDDMSLALELLEIFMTLEQKFPVDNFETIVYNCAVEITIIYPIECAEFLCKHFHAEIGSYTITQRVFMLDILSEASRELSSIKNEKKIKREKSQLEMAEDTIRRRLESKTRRFFSSCAEARNVNKFAKVASSFFFPLIYGFRSFVTFAEKPHYDTDNILLIHFLKTVCIIMYSAQNCSIAPRMGKEILDMTFTIRFHKESKVRLAVMHLIGSVVLNVPKSILQTELLNELVEVRLWLVNVLSCSVERSEANTECRIIASNILCLVENALKVETNEFVY